MRAKTVKRALRHSSFTGNRRGGEILVYHDYRYQKNKAVSGRIYWCCCQRQCGATVTTNNFDFQAANPNISVLWQQYKHHLWVILWVCDIHFLPSQETDVEVKVQHQSTKQPASQEESESTSKKGKKMGLVTWRLQQLRNGCCKRRWWRQETPGFDLDLLWEWCNVSIKALVL